MKGRRSAFIAAVVILAVIAGFPAAAAQDMRTGGNVVVADGETVQGLSATGGTVQVLGTVEGDLNVAGGDIAVSGNVTGDMTAIGGSITVPGSVSGNASLFGGSVTIPESGRIGGSLESAAGSVVLDGVVGEDVRVDADRFRIGPTATIGGGIEHATRSLSLSPNASVAGDIEGVDSVRFQRGLPVQTDVPWWLFSVYGFIVSLVLGAVLVFMFPEYAFDMADRSAERPGMTLLTGLLVLILIPVVLFLLVVTIIGIPIAILGFFLFLLTLWIASIYGSFTIGAALIDAVDRRNRWMALVTGLLVVYLLGAIPFVGGLIHFLVMLLGLGGIARGRH